MNSYNFETDTITYKDHVIENFFKSFPQQDYIKDYVKNNLICLYVGGSHAYGLDTDTSDVDIRGIFKDNIDMILGYERVYQLANESQDIVIYSLSKALPLIAEQNPNMMEVLFVDEEEILFATDDYWYLRSRRHEFLSKLSRQKYSGYAISQLSRLKGHSRWLVKEQEGKFDKKPNIKDYIIHIDNQNGRVLKLKYSHLFNRYEKIGLVKRILLKLFVPLKNILIKEEDYSSLYFTKVKDEIYNMWKDEQNSNYLGIIWFNKSQFQKDLEEYNNWGKWKENRNEKRHELEEKFGFDTKHAMHTYRLLNTGIEILNGEGCKVKRPDRDFLLDIRNGKYTYEWIIAEAERLYKVVLDECYRNSKLQHSVDKKIVVDLIKEILKL
jgi:uncharacterized protein